ncbi:hypothetical protein BC628DRAFT_1545063 [Trametes gibbosa]|nr:hypothetical protein BC628DRAFT_1545063 [Trametes gibbosa]
MRTEVLLLPFVCMMILISTSPVAATPLAIGDLSGTLSPQHIHAATTSDTVSTENPVSAPHTRRRLWRPRVHP